MRRGLRFFILGDPGAYSGGKGNVGMSSDRQPDTYLDDFLSVPQGKNSGRVNLHHLTECAKYLLTAAEHLNVYAAKIIGSISKK